MWRLNALPRLILPVAVFLKRLAAPLCVFSLGINSCRQFWRRISCYLLAYGLALAGLGCGLLRWFILFFCSASLLLFCARHLLGGRQDHVHSIAFHARPEFHNPFVANLVDQPFQDFSSQVLVGHFPSAEAKAGFDLVTF